MKLYRLFDLLCSVVYVFFAGGFFAFRHRPVLLLPMIPAFLAALMLPGLLRRDVMGLRLRICYHGSVTLALGLISSLPLIGYHLVLFLDYLHGEMLFYDWLYSAIFAFSMMAVVFFSASLSVFLTSGQLGLRWRVMLLCFWMIPLVNLYVVGQVIDRTHREVELGLLRSGRNAARRDARVCETKYPLLLVHGFFFRDWTLFNYWGRIPEELKANGATVYYGNHQSARPVADSAAELAARIREIVATTGCGKVNIIAHSKGGLDCRYALAHLGIEDMVASLTTVSTPHRGCLFAEKLLSAVKPEIQEKVAAAYNGALKLLGDTDPDFLCAVHDLTASVCIARDRDMPPPASVYCQSFGSRQVRGSAGRFPLNLSYHIVKRHDGPNDGLVAVDSFPFGESFTLIETQGRRGISHGDMIDLSREDIRGFDVRELYVGIVSDLKSRGY